jgi:hypothetical protein
VEEDNMRNALLICLAVLAAYSLGTLRAPARAELKELSTQELLALMVQTQREQTEAIRAIGKGLEPFSHFGEATRHDREQTEALQAIAKELASQRERTDALRTIARATERIAGK